MSYLDDYNARERKQDGAWDTLAAEQQAWSAADEACKAAKKAYFDKASEHGIRLCDRCAKPMPGYDTSQHCDGCHLPWGWSTPEGRRKREAAEMKAKIAAMQAQLAKLEGEAK